MTLNISRRLSQSAMWYLGRVLLILSYFVGGVFTISVFTLTLVSFVSIVSNDLNFNLFRSGTFAWASGISLMVLVLLFAVRHTFYLCPWIRWTKAAYVVGGAVGFILAFLYLLFIVIIISLASEV